MDADLSCCLPTESISLPEITPVVCENSSDTIHTKKESSRISVFTDYEIKKSIYSGHSWAKKCDEIVDKLPKDKNFIF